jgi:hypothetical protein
MKGKFCPACQMVNEYTAEKCIYCDTVLAGPSHETPTTEKMAAALLNKQKDFFSINIDITSIPAGDLVIYIAGEEEPVVFMQPTYVLLGRGMETGNQVTLDLGPHDGASRGVSRMHAEISRVVDGFAITDLASTNGTWVNQERLLVGKSHLLSGIDIVTLGRMKLMVLFHPTE